MKLTIWTLWIASIISDGLANLPTLKDLDRELTFLIHPMKTDSTDNHGPKVFLSHRREIPTVFENSDQNSDLKRDQSYYERTRNSYSTLNRNETAPTMKVFRTYGRGKTQVRQGQTVDVPNEVAQNKKSSMATKVLDKNENEIKAVRHQRGCKECPVDQTVIAAKGNIFALLPEPCQPNPKMWIHYSGPQPGSKIPEGVHLIRGYMGPQRKFCQYNYQVLVRRCEPLTMKEDAAIECSAENSWGSKCNVTCGYEKEPIGPIELECKENLNWSNPVPKCKGKTDCLMPKVKTNSRISCQRANKKELEEDILPNGSSCKFKHNEKEVSINCKDGKWRITRKSKALIKKNKQTNKNKISKNNVCNPNPCQNGGTCMKPESNKGPPICKCRPQTRGIHCEMRECYYNICENDGLCFFKDEERICYCTSEYSGDLCQHYTPQ